MGVVTIRGQLGSGAPEIGKEIARRLKCDYVDREIIAGVAARLHRPEDEVTDKEMPPSSILGRIAKALKDSLAYSAGAEGAFLPTWEIPLTDTRYLPALESVVRELARTPTIVIRGRGSQFILRDHPAAFHVLVVAPLEVRLRRVMTDLNLDQESAKQEIVRLDSSRREFIRRYFQAELEDPVFYDLTLNTGKLDLEAAAAIVVDALSFKVRS
jgi:Cytidylate kinase-like family